MFWTKFKKFSTFWKIVMIVVLIWWSFWWYTYYKWKNTTTSYTLITTQVKKWSIENSIKVTWTANLVDEQQMRFNQTWKVAAVYFKDWATVKKWQIIAKLDDTDVLNSIKQSQITLSNSEIQLQQKLKPAEQKDLLSAQNNIDNAQKNITLYNEQLTNLYTERDNKLKDIENQITSKSADIESQKNTIKLLNDQLDVLVKQWDKNVSDMNVDLKNTLETAYTDSRKYLIDADNLLLDIDEIYGISELNKNRNDSFETFLSAKNSTLKISVEDQYWKIKSKLDQTQSLYSQISDKSSDNIKNLLNNISSLYQSLIYIWKTAADWVNSSITSTTFSQTTIDSYYSSMTQIISSSQSTYNTISTTIKNIDKLSDPTLQQQSNQNDITNKKNSIVDAQAKLTTLNNDLQALKNNLELSKKNYETQIKQKQNDIQNTQNSLAVYKENLKDLQKWADYEEIALARNDIAKQKLSMENTKKNLEKYWLEAPFDGVIRKIDFKVWDNIVSDEEKYVYIENPNLLEITAQLDQIDVVKVSVWQKVRIVFDSYTAKEYEWSVSEINSTPATTSWVTSYTVTITMDKWKDNLYSWMTAKIYIINESKKWILIVPSTFVQKRSDKSFVLVSSWEWQTQMKEIVTWITDSTNIEVVSWLEEWDKIVRRVATTAKTTSTQTSLLGNGPWSWTRSGSSSYRQSSWWSNWWWWMPPQ